jgi:hypothetical protein
MSDFTANTAIASAPQKSILSVFGLLFDGVSRGYRAYRAYNELNAKSDRQLAEMGLTRADVATIAAKPIFAFRDPARPKA